MPGVNIGLQQQANKANYLGKHLCGSRTGGGRWNDMRSGLLSAVRCIGGGGGLINGMTED